MWKPHALMLLFAILHGLSPAKVVAGAEAPVPCRPSAVQGDEDVLPMLLKCEAAAATLTDAVEKSEAYLALGRLHLRLPHALIYRFANTVGPQYAEGESTLAAFAQQRPDQYRYWEIADGYFYNGWHFKKILSDLEASGFADEAAYELARMTPGGECEGLLDCYVERSTIPLVEFLERYPTSPWCSEAIAETLKRLQYNLDTWIDRFGVPPEYAAPSSGYDPDAIARTLRRFEASAAGLSPELGAQALFGLAEFWTRLESYGEARRLFEGVLERFPDYPDARRRLNALPR